MLAIVTLEKQSFVSESESTKSVALKFCICFPNHGQIEIDSNKIGSLWLQSKKVQSVFPLLMFPFWYFHE